MNISFNDFVKKMFEGLYVAGGYVVELHCRFKSYPDRLFKYKLKDYLFYNKNK